MPSAGRHPESKLHSLAIVVSSGLGAAAYLLALREYYSGWVVLAASMLAVPGAMIVTCLLSLSCDSPLSRVLIIGVGSMFLYYGWTLPDRLGTLLMGIAFLVIGVLASRRATTSTEPSRSEADQSASGEAQR